MKIGTEGKNYPRKITNGKNVNGTGFRIQRPNAKKMVNTESAHQRRTINHNLQPRRCLDCMSVRHKGPDFTSVVHDQIPNNLLAPT